MTKVLVDSSVWIDFFSGNNPRAKVLADLIDYNTVCTNYLILSEIIPFIKKKGESDLVALLMAITNIRIDIDWEDIIKMQSDNLKHGLNKVGIPDLMILQNVIKHDLILFTFDKHFKLMAGFHKFKMFETHSF